MDGDRGGWWTVDGGRGGCYMTVTGEAGGR